MSRVQSGRTRSRRRRSKRFGRKGNSSRPRTPNPRRGDSGRECACRAATCTPAHAEYSRPLDIQVPVAVCVRVFSSTDPFNAIQKRRPVYAVQHTCATTRQTRCRPAAAVVAAARRVSVPRASQCARGARVCGMTDVCGCVLLSSTARSRRGSRPQLRVVCTGLPVRWLLL